MCTIALGTCLWIGTTARKTGSVMLQPAVCNQQSSVTRKVKRQCYILGCSVLVTAAIAATGFTLIAGFMGLKNIVEN